MLTLQRGCAASPRGGPTPPEAQRWRPPPGHAQQLGSAVPETSSPGRPAPHPHSTPKLLSALPTMALGLSLQTPSPELRPRFNTPERTRELRLCPPHQGAGPVPLGPMLRAPAPWAGSQGWGGVFSVPLCCPSRAAPGPAPLGFPIRHELLLGFHPQPRNREAQYPAGSRSYLQGPPRLSASPPPSCISERLHFFRESTLTCEP